MRFKVCILILLLVLIPGLCMAGEVMDDLDIGANIAFNSAYIWRAQNLVDNPVLQPTAYVSYKGFTFNFWSNWDVTGEREFTEIDYTWDYSTDLGFLTSKKDVFDKVNITGGYTFYTFPNLDEDDISNEVFVGILFDMFLNPSYTAYWDFDTGNGWYHEWGIGHTFNFDPIEIETGLSMGLNVEQWGFDTSFTALNFSVASSIPLSAIYNTKPFEYITLKPQIAYSLPLDDQYDHEVYGGLCVEIDF